MQTGHLKHCAPLLLLLLALGCGQKSPDSAPVPITGSSTPLPAPDTAANAQAKASTGGDSSIKMVQGTLTEEQIERAKKQAERVWKAMGPQVMAKMVEEQLGVFRDALAKVTTAVKDQKWAEAKTEIETLVAENKPNEPRLWIELATTAAALGDDATAERAAMHTLWRQLDLRVRTRGLVLLGDLAAKRGDKSRAALYYRHALETQPDKAITAKLKATLSQTDKAPLAELIGLQAAPIGPAKDIEALCQQLYAAFPAPEKEVRTCAVQAGRNSRATDGALEEAAVVTLTSGETDSHEILALKGPQGWQAVSYLAYVSKLASLWAKPDAFALTSLTFGQIIPLGPQELVIKYTHTITDDCDPGMNEREQSERKMLELWKLDGEVLQNPLRLPYAMTLARTALNDSFETIFDKKLRSAKKLPVNVAYELEVSFSADGQPKAEVMSGAVPKEFQGLLKAKGKK